LVPQDESQLVFCFAALFFGNLVAARVASYLDAQLRRQRAAAHLVFVARFRCFNRCRSVSE
jgi:hypothetical protein